MNKKIRHIEIEGLSFYLNQARGPANGRPAQCGCPQCGLIATECKPIVDVIQHGVWEEKYLTGFRCPKDGNEFFCMYTVEHDE